MVLGKTKPGIPRPSMWRGKCSSSEVYKGCILWWIWLVFLQRSYIFWGCSCMLFARKIICFFLVWHLSVIRESFIDFRFWCQVVQEKLLILSVWMKLYLPSMIGTWIGAFLQWLVSSLQVFHNYFEFQHVQRWS